MTDWTRSDTPRTWHFWAIWAAIRLVLGIVFYALGWMPAFWFLLGELVPDAMWYLRDEQLKATKRLIRRLAHLQAQIDMRSAHMANRDQRDRPSASSITTSPRWTATSKNSH